MNYRKVAISTIYAFTAQGVSFLLSVVQSLLVPKMLGVEQYAYWQLFTFYSGYVGFFHFGLNDGVYLLNGGRTRDAIDKRSVNSQLAFAILSQSFIAVLMLGVAMVLHPSASRLFVISCTALFLVVQNAASYLMYLLQAMNETERSSISTIVNRFSYLLPLLGFLVLGVTSFKPFVIAYLCSVGLQLLYCAWHCREILAAGIEGPAKAAHDSFASIRVGVKLMIANTASSLVLGVLRVVIDGVWGIQTFGKLSFSLALVGFFLAFVSQAAMVLFPALRQSDEDEVRRFFVIARDMLSLCFPAVYLLYFPMVWVLGLWLPAYADSLYYFAWLLPICVFDSKMNITCTTMLKVKRQEGLLLRINIATTVACAAMVLFGAYALHSVEASVAAATLAIMGRSVVSERIVSRHMGVPTDDLSLWEAFLTIAFVALALLAPRFVAVFSYLGLYLAFLAAHRLNTRAIVSYASALFPGSGTAEEQY